MEICWLSQPNCQAHYSCKLWMTYTLGRDETIYKCHFELSEKTGQVSYNSGEGYKMQGKTHTKKRILSHWDVENISFERVEVSGRPFCFPPPLPSPLSLTHTHTKETHHTLFSKVDAYCRDELWVELVVCVSIQQSGLSNPRISEGQEFDQIVIVPISHSADLDEPANQEKRKISRKEQKEQNLALRTGRNAVLAPLNPTAYQLATPLLTEYQSSA